MQRKPGVLVPTGLCGPQEVDDPTQVRSSGEAHDCVNDCVNGSVNDSAWESVSYADASGSLDVSLISHGVSPPEVASRGSPSQPHTLHPEPCFSLRRRVARGSVSCVVFRIQGLVQSAFCAGLRVRHEGVVHHADSVSCFSSVAGSAHESRRKKWRSTATFLAACVCSCVRARTDLWNRYRSRAAGKRPLDWASGSYRPSVLVSVARILPQVCRFVLAFRVQAWVCGRESACRC